MKKKKQSIVLAGLISTSGLFLSKAIGIFYLVPFNAIVGTENMVFYAQAYNVYAYMLNIFTAGFPLAIAALVTRYVTMEDYHTAFLIKKLAKRVMVVLGMIAALLLMVCSGVIAPLMVSKSAEDIEIMRNVLVVLAFALMFVPYLSAMRGFYQGMKDMEVYAVSQVLEQFSRVIFLLAAGAISVYIFHTNRIVAIYFAVFSAAVSALFAILHISLYDRKKMKEFRKKEATQPIIMRKDSKLLFKEMVRMSVPYLVMAVFGYSDMMINSLFLPSGLAAYGYSSSMINVITGVISGNVQKLMAIPMVLAPGFTAAIIPCLTASVVHNDRIGIRKSMTDCISSVLYIGIPVSFCLFAFAKGIYFTMYGSDYLNINADILRWYSLEAFLNTIGPIFTSIMMAVGLRRLQMKYLAVYALVKGVTTYPLIAMFSYPGSVFSTLLAMTACIVLCIHALHKHFGLELKELSSRMVKIVICTLTIWLTAKGMSALGWDGYGTNRLFALLELGISGGLAMLLYAASTLIFHLPERIFDFHIEAFCKIHKRK